jgi:integral membrane protein (TIGR01906 family)
VKSLTARTSGVLVAVATAIVILTVSIIPLLTPAWVGFEQDRAEATAWTGYSAADLRVATDAIVANLVFGGDFDVAVNGGSVLNERERAHMSDVRTVFRGLWVLAAASAVILLVAALRADRAGVWPAVRHGALGLTVGVVIAGLVGLVAFDQLFTLFHRIFFPAGSYLFDPTTDRLVQLFPFRFWDESAMVAGVLIIAVALGVAFFAGRRARSVVRRPDAAELAVVHEPGS